MTAEDDKIRKAFENRDWNEIKTADSWQIFKVMAEFVDGFEKMSDSVQQLLYHMLILHKCLYHNQATSHTT